MDDEQMEPTRPRISAAAVFFAMTSHLPVTPTMTFCEEIADRANRFPHFRIYLSPFGWIVTGGAKERLVVDATLIIDANGITTEWSDELIKACIAGSNVYGIPGLT